MSSRGSHGADRIIHGCHEFIFGLKCGCNGMASRDVGCLGIGEGFHLPPKGYALDHSLQFLALLHSKIAIPRIHYAAGRSRQPGIELESRAHDTARFALLVRSNRPRASASCGVRETDMVSAASSRGTFRRPTLRRRGLGLDFRLRDIVLRTRASSMKPTNERPRHRAAPPHP